jgi:anaerobic dimethyl sulfoxide reductase subunit B (iron-sulfur subunit)
LKQLGIYYDQTRCVGCYTCVVACKDWHDVPAGPASWMKVHSIEKGTFPDLFAAYLIRPCYHCEYPLCVSACPADAIHKSAETGIVSVDRKLCLGLESCGGMCRESCPYEAPQFGAGEDRRMQKCDLCAERWAEGKKPICVEGCPMRALDAGPLKELIQKYGDNHDAAGFEYRADLKPSIVIKGKLP